MTNQTIRWVVCYRIKGQNKTYYLGVRNVGEEVHFLFDTFITDELKNATHFESASQASFYNERCTYKRKHGFIKAIKFDH
jgi:hypothetical protein